MSVDTTRGASMGVPPCDARQSQQPMCATLATTIPFASLCAAYPDKGVTRACEGLVGSLDGESLVMDADGH